jgi:hypothetical protein
MKKEKKDQIIRRISEQSMLKLTPMPFRASITRSFSLPPATPRVMDCGNPSDLILDELLEKLSSTSKI